MIDTYEHMTTLVYIYIGALFTYNMYTDDNAILRSEPLSKCVSCHTVSKARPWTAAWITSLSKQTGHTIWEVAVGWSQQTLST